MKKKAALPVAAPAARRVSVADLEADAGPRWDDRGPAPRRKPKRRKFKTVSHHGYEQSVPCGSDDDEEVVEKPPVPAAKPIIARARADVETRSSRGAAGRSR